MLFSTVNNEATENKISLNSSAGVWFDNEVIVRSYICERRRRVESPDQIQVRCYAGVVVEKKRVLQHAERVRAASRRDGRGQIVLQYPVRGFAKEGCRVVAGSCEIRVDLWDRLLR